MEYDEQQENSDNEGTTNGQYGASLIKYYYYIITLHTMLLCTCLIKTADMEQNEKELEDKQKEEKQ